MIGIVSYRSRQHCRDCGGRGLLPVGEDITPAEREAIFAYHAQIRHRYGKSSQQP